MNEVANRLLLFAERARLSDMGRKFRESASGGNYFELAILVLVLIGVGVGIWLLVRRVQTSERGSYHDSRSLFTELCDVHELSREQRQLLGRLAESQATPQPAHIFLDPDRFDVAASELASDEERVHVERLRALLFAAAPVADTE